MKILGNYLSKMMLSIIFIITAIAIVQSEDTKDKDKAITIDKSDLDSHMFDLYGMFNDMFTEDDMDLQYFSTHDTDRNDKIDGLELFSAMHPQHNHGPESLDFASFNGKTEKEVDEILSQFDKDNDGFLDYSEFQSVDKIHEKIPSTEKPKDTKI